MLSDNFWFVELGRGMGPFSMGQARSEVLRILREQSVECDFDDDDESELYTDEIDSQFVFSADAQRSLKRMDVDDKRLRFGSLQVHDKPVHEIVKLLDALPSETMWCDFYEDEDQARHGTKCPEIKSDRELLMSGTLWITPLGLGLSLYRCTIVTVHLCDPANAPRIGNGHWTPEQQRLSEAGIAPVATTLTATGKSPLSRILLLGVAIAMSALVWKAIVLQQKWNHAPEVTALVTATNPPPPDPFPDEYTLTYSDTTGSEYSVVFRSTDLYGLPAIGDEINIRFLPEAPDKPLSHSRHRDVGFDFAVPYGIAIFGSYWIIQLLGSLLALFPINPSSGKRWS